MTYIQGGGGGGGPTGAAGGVLGGTYPNPGFAADMATQAELDAAVAAVDPDPLELADSAEPSPVAGTVVVYGATRADGQVVPWATPNIGKSFPLQASMARKLVYALTPSNGSLAQGATGFSAGTTNGTVTYSTGGTSDSAAPDTSSMPLTMLTRVVMTTSTANNGAGFRAADQNWQRGGQAPVGGFYASLRFAIRALGSDGRIFVGLTAFNGSLTGDPSGIGSYCLGALVKDSADTNIHFLVNEAGGTQAKIDLGFAITGDDTKIYELELFLAPQGTTVYYRVRRVDDDSIPAEGSQDVSFVNANGRTRFYAYAGAGAVATAATIAILRLYGERDA